MQNKTTQGNLASKVGIMIKRVAAGLLVICVVFALGVPAHADTLVQGDNWLYAAFGELAAVGLLSEYPLGLAGSDRELTRFEFAYHLKGLLERLEASLSENKPLPCTPSQFDIIERCVTELRRELLALGVSVRSIDEVTGLKEPYSGGAARHEFVDLSLVTDNASLPWFPVEREYYFCSMVPVSFGLSGEPQLQLVSDTPASLFALWPGDVLGSPAAPEQLWPGVQPATLLDAFSAAPDRSKTQINWQRSLSILTGQAPWGFRTGASPSLGLASTPTLARGTQISGETAHAATIGSQTGGRNTPGSAATAVVQAPVSNPVYGQSGLDVSLEIGHYIIDTQSTVGSLLPGLSSLNGQVGLRARTDYTSLGTLAGDTGARAATVSIEGKFVFGTFATVYGGYGYSAVRTTVAEQFILNQSLTNAGVNVWLTPDLQLFAEYTVLAPSQPGQQSQAILGISHSDLGSLLFGYRLLRLGEAQILASFSLEF